MIKKVHFCFSVFSNFYTEDNLTIVMKRMCSILIIALVLGVSTGCPLNTGNIENAVYSYNIDELAEGIFYSPFQTMTMNEWFLMVPNPPISYDAWSQQSGLQIFMDKELKTPFTGSDTINENTVFHTDFPLNDYGKKTGIITGTITLTDIPSLTPKVWIHSISPGRWWFIGKLNLGEINGSSAMFNWAIPVYEPRFEGWGFKSETESQFELFILPGGGKLGYIVSVPAKKIISNANSDTGSLGTVSIKGVTISGTINVTYNGEPVPYVEISIIDDGGALLNIAYSSSSGSNIPWSATLAPSSTPKRIEFQIYAFSKSSPTASDILFDEYYVPDPIIYLSNQDLPGILIDLGDLGY